MTTFSKKHLKDYQVPDFYIKSVHLHFDIYDELTLVKAQYNVKRNSKANSSTSNMVLNGENMQLNSVHIDGRILNSDKYTVTDKLLTINNVGNEFILDIEVEIKPHLNKALCGFYQSKNILITQCEPHGFRKIVYSLDRPDVSSIYTTSITANVEKYPVLLSNGNKEAELMLDNERKLVIWNDPHPKSCYLFALVAGDLAKVSDTYTTLTNRTIDLEMYVDAGYEDQCVFALESIKKSMLWDEQKYNREYDLDIFMVVAASDFNAGAMENKGLNIFNISYINTHEKISTDVEYDRVLSVVAHEYFHNWSGNRVTCRDWFQISLKEGLTVYREHQFMEDITPLNLNRVDAIVHMQSQQFPEDASALAHQVQPDSYIEINNFYTNTIYYKGAEIIRMMHILLGDSKYYQAVEHYFAKYDGTCATIDDFAGCMEHSSGMDLTQFKHWYKQKGTPTISISKSYSKENKSFEVTITQSKPKNDDNEHLYPLVIPVEVAFFSQDGKTQSVKYKDDVANAHVLVLSENSQTFKFANVSSEPVVSYLRGMSAPVILDYEYSITELKILMEFESDDYIRFDAAKRLHINTIVTVMDAISNDRAPTISEKYLNILSSMMKAYSKPDSYIMLSYMLTLPKLKSILQELSDIDVDIIYKSYQFIEKAIYKHLSKSIKSLFDELQNSQVIFEHEKASRVLQHTLLSYLTSDRLEVDAEFCATLLKNTDNTTTMVSILSNLGKIDSNVRTENMQVFLDKWKNHQNTYDKWLRLASQMDSEDVFNAIRDIKTHKSYSDTNPNNIRALFGSFSSENLRFFHDKSGRGYKVLADEIIRVDTFNPQLSSRMMQAFADIRKFDQKTQTLMQLSINNILKPTNISKNLYEIASKILES